jgi:hypothetical protein
MQYVFYFLEEVVLLAQGDTASSLLTLSSLTFRFCRRSRWHIFDETETLSM